MHFGTFGVALSLCLLLISPSFGAASESAQQSFSKCISYNTQQYGRISNITIASDSPDFLAVYNAYVREPRFLNSSTPKPLFIITATETSHVQGAIVCARRSGLQVRIRSGGHDYEGLSYMAGVPFVLIDLNNLRSVCVDIPTESAWIDSGATLGDVYFRISEKSNVYAFPAGSCSTVGIGGHLGCGGFGFIFRKFGLSADTVLDAKIVDVHGRLLTRDTMGEDLFWAIRGGGPGSFGVVVSWKVRIVPVPPIVTRFSVDYTLAEGGARLLQKWQDVAYRLPEDLFLRVVLILSDNATLTVSFQSLYLGRVDRLLSVLQGRFPELNVRRENCTEMTWIQSAVDLAGFPFNGSATVLLNRTTQQVVASKMKSDYVTVNRPIPEAGYDGLFELILQSNMSSLYLILTPYGEMMARIPVNAIPFPHRFGTNYGIQYGVSWDVDDDTQAQKALSDIRRVYEYMEQYVSRGPRSAYLCYRDLDLGTNGRDGIADFREASVWGFKYFNNNFNRLVRVKTAVDPDNFFRYEQSTPPDFHRGCNC